MKKLFTLFISLVVLKASFATIHNVTVSDFQFNPASLNAVVGDTIKWTWLLGTHTTTSVTIPSGAAAWDHDMTSTSTTFEYVLTVAGTYNYKCKPHAAFGMVATLTVSGTLPVVLNKFGVSATKLNGALLSWSTATEQNTDHFDVMRSSDGNNFTKIASVAAKGNSSALVNYSYTDGHLPSSYRYLYYSLNIIDKDGKKTLSKIIMFSNADGAPKLIVSLSPNPISRPGHLMLQFNADNQGTMHAQLFDASGKLVKQADLSAVAGLNNGHFHVGDVAPGTYTIVFTMGSQKESYRLVVQ